MDLKKHGKIFLNGLAIITPLVITIAVVVASVRWLDRTMQAAFEALFHFYLPGLGFVAAFATIYVVGLLARSWLLTQFIRLAEAIVERIPLVKSLYSAVRDLMQFLSGGDAESRGKPCIVRYGDGDGRLLGLVTTENPQRFLPDDGEGRIAVYLPLSYQLGGFTLYVPRQRVQIIEGMSVEELLKLCLTAGVGAHSPASNIAAEHKDKPGRYKEKHA